MPSIFKAARSRQIRAAATGLLALALCAPAFADASAETRVRVRYSVTVAGFEVGTATMQTGIDRASYDMNLSVRMTGLVKFFTGGKGAVTSRGGLNDSRVIPTAYALNTRANDKGQIVRFALLGGAVRQMSIEPPVKTKDIIPVSDADKRGIVDPLSALIMPVSGSGDVLSPASCDRTIPVFDGRQRYDVRLHFDRMEKATADQGAKGSYDGKLVVCKASYKAISGHKPDKPSVVFMENNKDMEVWLAPVGATRELLPWKISVRTQIGTAVITATSFVIDEGDKAPDAAPKTNL